MMSLEDKCVFPLAMSISFKIVLIRLTDKGGYRWLPLYDRGGQPLVVLLPVNMLLQNSCLVTVAGLIEFDLFHFIF